MHETLKNARECATIQLREIDPLKIQHNLQHWCGLVVLYD